MNSYIDLALPLCAVFVLIMLPPLLGRPKVVCHSLGVGLEDLVRQSFGKAVLGFRSAAGQRLRVDVVELTVIPEGCFLTKAFIAVILLGAGCFLVEAMVARETYMSLPPPPPLHIQSSPDAPISR